MVRMEGWRWGIGGEEFDVEGIGGVDGDHGFGIVIEIFKEGFA